MIYPYKCDCCRNNWDVIKPIADIDKAEKCPDCGNMGTRTIASRGHFYGAEVEDAEFCPAFGCIIKNKAHRRRLAKERGLIEFGNEDPNKYFDQKRADKDAENKRFYDDIGTDRIVLGSR